MPPRPTIALADDDGAYADLLVAGLQHHGYEVIHFPSGDALVEWAGETPGAADAFLLDVDMPGRDGFESCAELRRLPAYGETPAVFVSTLVAEPLRERVQAAGGTWMVRKDREALPRLVEWLGDNLRVVG